MSNFRSDKCTKAEAQAFKREVLVWLKEKKLTVKKIRMLTCYNGDFRIYIGHNEFPNRKSSFRQTEPQYVSINRDEFAKLKEVYENKDHEEYAFYDYYIFRYLRP